MTKPTVTAAVLVIGDEILSGRTKDRNLGYIAEYLAKIGVDVREARVVPDVEDEIAPAVNALRARYDYVITTGGIGPTHDDITADSIGRAFGVPVGEDPRAIAIMLERYAPADLTPARRRMARIPEGADLIENPISRAPGFRIGNVFVLAGVPAVMQAMWPISNGRKRLVFPVATSAAPSPVPTASRASAAIHENGVDASRRRSQRIASANVATPRITWRATLP